MGWKVLIIAVVLGLGFARLLLDITAQSSDVDLKKAIDVAGCLAPKTEVKQGNALTLLRVPPDPPVNPPPVVTLDFKPLTTFQVELPTAELEQQLEKTTEKTLRLPANSPLLLTKNKGSFEFRLNAGTKAEVRQAKARLFLQTDDPVRFGPTDDANYPVFFPTDVQLDVRQSNSKNQAMLPAGTTGKLSIGEGQTLILLQPITASPWAFKIARTVVPVRATGQSGLAGLSVEARQPGVGFNAAGFTLSACASSEGGKNFQPIGVKTADARDGAATLLLTLPEALLPTWPPVVLWNNIDVIVASSDGQYIGYGGFAAVGRILSAIVSLLLTSALFWWVASLRHEHRGIRLGVGKQRDKSDPQWNAWKKDWRQWFSGLFIGADNDPSLSLFQVFLWTVITVWGLLYVFTITGSLLTLTQEMLWLLGIAGAGSIAARWIAGTTPGGSTSQAPGAAPPAAAPGATPTLEFWQILCTNGRFDLLKLQIFVFTLMVAVYVVWRIADAGVFPELGTNTLLLLGVSQGVYIGGKVAGSTAFARAQTLKADLDEKTAQKQKLVDEQTTLTQEQAKAKAATPPGDLTPQQKSRLNDLTDLIKGKEKEISDTRIQYENTLKELGLKLA